MMTDTPHSHTTSPAHEPIATAPSSHPDYVQDDAPQSLHGSTAASTENSSSGGGCCGSMIDAVSGCVSKVMPSGGVLSSAFNMASSSIGAGILGLPSATDAAGLLLAMIYLVIITAFSVYSMRILAITAEKTQIRSFDGLSRWLFPGRNYAFSYFAAFIRCFHSFAADVAYVISIGNCFHPIIGEALDRDPGNSALEYLHSTNGNRLICFLGWLVFMLPLVIPKHVDSLRYVSAFAVTFMIYFVIIIVVHSCSNGLKENVKNVRGDDASGYDPDTDPNAIFLFRSGNDVVNSVGVFMFAYVCQITALEIHSDMRPEVRTTNNYTLAAFIGMLLCGILYVLVCFFGYFDFGSKYLLNQSILLMYNPLDEPAIFIAYIGVMCKLCVSYALLTAAARNSIYYMLGWQEKYAAKGDRAVLVAAGAAAANDDVTSVEATVGDEDNNNNVDAAEANKKIDDENASATSDDKRLADTDSNIHNNPYEAAAANVTAMAPIAAATADEADDTFVDNIPMWKHLIVVGAIAVASLLCGLFIPNINMVFGFAGAISGGFIAFVFPALFYMYSGNWTIQEIGIWDYCLTYALLICGVIGIIFGTGGTIYNTI